MENEIITGACRYCGQLHQTTGVTQEEADRIATQACQCDGARKEKRIRDVIRDAREKADDLLGEIGEQEGFIQVENEGVRGLINDAITLVAYGELREASLQIIGRGVVKVKSSGIGGVKIERTRTLKRSEETA